MCQRDPRQCIIPPYINQHLAKSDDPVVRARAVANLQVAATMRAMRVMSQSMPSLMVTAAASRTRTKQRQVFDAQGRDVLPGTIARSEGQAKTADKAVNQAYDFSGDTYDFYSEIFDRNSLDDAGMMLTSSVHVAETGDAGGFVPMNNAFWNGEQMAYGDGDGVVFRSFTGSLDVVGHELTHGVESFTSNLEYRDQSGALNEHFADVFGVLIGQWKNGETALKGNWLVGAEVLVPAPTRRAIRDMENPGTAFVNDPDIGTDPQPGHMRQLFKGAADRGGVHINSGIPNRAFVLFAKALKGKAWEVAGRVWYETMLQLTTTSQIADCARISVQISGTPKYGAAVKRALRTAWRTVGVTV